MLTSRMGMDFPVAALCSHLCTTAYLPFSCLKLTATEASITITVLVL